MRGVVLGVVCAVLLAALPSVSAAQTGEVVAVERPAGPDANVEVAIALSEVTDVAGVGTVLIARDDQFADALASGVLQAGAPLLLVPSGGPVPPAVADRLTELAPSRVVILGGEDAVSPAVEAELAEAHAVERRAGASRLETAIEIARADAPAVSSAILARAFPGEGSGDATQAFADSLAAGGWAAASGQPVLLTQTDVLSAATATYLAESGITTVTIIGGAAAVSDAVETAVRELGIAVERVAGASRFDTAVAVATARGSASGRAIVVEGQAADAWAAGFAAARRSAVLDAPIVLTTGATLPEATAAYLGGLTGAEGDPGQLTCVTDPAACDAAVAARGAEVSPFTLEAEILADDPFATDYLGVSIDVDGDRMVVGAVRPGNNPGRALVYEREGDGEWQQVAMFDNPGDGCAAFGSAATIDGDTIVVGAPRACGSAVEFLQVITRDPQGTWVPGQIVETPSEGSTTFGSTVSLDDGTLFTARHTATTPAPNLSIGHGQVEIYRQAADGSFALAQAIRGPAAGVQMGTDVEVRGDQAVATSGPDTSTGNANPTFVFQRDASGSWAIAAALDVDALGETNVPQVDLADDVIAVGDRLGDDRTGAVMVFRTDGDGWDGGIVVDADTAGFGSDVAFLGDLLVVGAADGIGQVHAFAPDGDDWIPIGVRGPDRPQGGDGLGTQAFGAALAVAGDRLLVGAPLHTGTLTHQGAVFEYTLDR